MVHYFTSFTCSGMNWTSEKFQQQTIFLMGKFSAVSTYIHDLTQLNSNDFRRIISFSSDEYTNSININVNYDIFLSCTSYSVWYTAHVLCQSATVQLSNRSCWIKLGCIHPVQDMIQQNSSYAVHSTTVHNGKTMLTAGEKTSLLICHGQIWAHQTFILFNSFQSAEQRSLKKARSNRERVQVEYVIVD